MRVIYFPLEAYQERYTAQLSGVGGWMETNFKLEGCSILRIEGEQLSQNLKSGVALDGCGRGAWCSSQITQFLKMLDQGEYFPEEDDVFYFDDFWHPGIEAIPYAFHIKKLPFPRMFAFAWAQSVDEFDFTVDMLPWYRNFERAIASVLEGIFVSVPMMKPLFVNGGIGDEKKVHVVGHPYCSEQVLSMMNPDTNWFDKNPDNKVLYTSRWDIEKQPQKFLQMIDVLSQYWDNFNKYEFVVTTSSLQMRSNNQELLVLLAEYSNKYPNLNIKVGLTKEEYYRELISAKVQVNTADQDWISWTLLEALTFGCMPVYPYSRGFPEVFNFRNKEQFLYYDVHDAANKIAYMCDNFKTMQNGTVKEKLTNLYQRYDLSVHRICQIMKGEYYVPCY